MKRQYEAELVFFANSTLLEGPRWNKHRRTIMCVSIEQNCVYEIDALNGRIWTYCFDDHVGCLAIISKDEILVAEHTGVYKLDLCSGEKKFLVQLNNDESLRYNDGFMDEKGRFLVGTTGYKRLAEKENVLYSWYEDEKKILIKGTTISNGIGFSKDNKYMYFVDSPTKCVTKYEYNMENGEIQFIGNIIEITDGSIPDGICVDVDDTIWVAQWGGAKVSHWNIETGEMLDEIILPCKNVTACCLGGDDFNELYITTAKHDDDTRSEELAGGLFKVKLR